MGTIIHRTVVVTSSHHEMLSIAHAKASSLNLPITPITHHPFNGYASFVVWTSGSKLGWDAYQEHSARVDDLLRFMQEYTNHVEWAVAVYGSDCDEPHLVTPRHADEG